MGRSRLSGVVRSAATASAATLAVVLAATLGAGTASAAITIDFKVTGGDYIKKTNSTVELGPGKLSINLDAATGNIVGDLTLPPAPSSFKVLLGLVPATATIDFIPVGKTTGRIYQGVVTSHSEVIVKLSNLKAAGIPIPVGDSCQSATPMAIDLTSGPGFSPVRGGKLTGTHVLPEFANCGLTGLLINLTVPGPDNVLSLNLQR